MAFFQLKNLTGYGWPTVPSGPVSQVWTAYQALERSQWLPADEIERCQLEQVRELLAHCIVHVPYYRRVLGEAGIVPAAVQTRDDFRRIPFLEKRIYQERSREFAAQKLPPGTTDAGETATSGSTGSPMVLRQTNIVNLWWLAFYLRDLEWSDVNPLGTVATIRSTRKKGEELERAMQGAFMPCWMVPLRDLIETGPAYGMDLHQEHRRQLEWLHKIGPDYILSYPSNLEVLAEVVRENGESVPNLRAIQAISDTLTDEARSRIESAFGVPVKNTYSCTETGYLASPCPAGHGLHVHSEGVLFEVLDDAGNPCQPGQTGRVALTSLNNFATPFVRYLVGDEVTLAPGSCSCGRGLPLLSAVHGKYRPMFRMADGRRKTSNGPTVILRKVGGHFQHQLIQRTLDHIVLRIVPAPSWTPGHADRIRRELLEFFEAPIRLDLEILDRIEVPAGGKFQNMVCEVV